MWRERKRWIIIQKEVCVKILQENQKEEKERGMEGMAPWVKLLATKPNDLSLMARTYIGEGEN